MLLRIFMIIFIILMCLTAWYMWHRRNGHFLIYDISGHPRAGKILKWTAIALLLEAVLGILILFANNKYLNLITLFLASFTILVFSLLIAQKDE